MSKHHTIIPTYKYQTKVRVKSGFYENHKGHIIRHLSYGNHGFNPDGWIARINRWFCVEDSYTIKLHTGCQVSERESNIEICKL